MLCLVHGNGIAIPNPTSYRLFSPCLFYLLSKINDPCLAYLFSRIVSPDDQCPGNIEGFFIPYTNVRDTKPTKNERETV